MFQPRRCARCREKFTPIYKVGSGYSYCGDCRSKNRKKEWANPTSRARIALINKHSHRKRLYGLTVEAFEQMVANQNGKCPICLKNLSDLKIAVDHCHKTGKIRGVLCHRCNRGIGLFEDDSSQLSRAVSYLNTTGEVPCTKLNR